MSRYLETMKTIPRLLLLPLLLSACVGMPPPEVPIEEAQRRLLKESPVLVVDGCLYRRNLAYVNQYVIDESRSLALDGAKEMIEGFKAYGVTIKQQVVPVMCASEMSPRGDEKGGNITPSASRPEEGKNLLFPEPLNASVAKDENLLAAYTQLFAACDDARYRKESRYDCPLLKPEQAALLKARLKASYVVALSLGGERASTGSRTAGVAFGLLLGFINIAGDEGTARLRLVNLDTGNLVYSSFPAEFRGRSPADAVFEGGGSELKITDDWVQRMIKPLFQKQR